MKLQHGAYILARYSTDNQEQDSIEVQVEKCSDWCQKNSIPVLDVFADYAVSGMKDTRPQYARMMQQLNTGGADTVVIYDQSRMFRKMTAWFQFRDELENLGVRVVSVTQPMIGGDLTDPTNFMTEGAMALFNQMWVLQTRQKVVEKMRFMAKNCQHTGGQPPLGYRVEEGRLAVDPEEAKTVVRIFELVDQGHSYRDILEKLNQEGIKTKRGNAFGTNSLHDLLKNKKYIGIYVYGKTAQRPNGTRNSHRASSQMIEIPDGCPAIVDKELFDRVQKKLEARRKTGGPKPKNEFALHGKVFCGECRSPMHIRYSGGSNKYVYYVCTAQKRTHVCASMPIRAQWLESEVANALRERLGKPKNLEQLLSILQEQRDSVQGAACGKLNALINRRNEISTQLENASNAILLGLTSQTLIDKVRTLENEKASIDHQMNQLKKDVDTTSLSDSEMEQALRTILDAADTSDAAILSIVYRVEVYDDKIDIWTILDADPNDPKHKKYNIPRESLPDPGEVAVLHNCLDSLGSTKKTSHPLGWLVFLVELGIEPI